MKDRWRVVAMMLLIFLLTSMTLSTRPQSPLSETKFSCGGKF